MTNKEFRQLATTMLTRPLAHSNLCADFINGFWRERGFDAGAKAIAAGPDPLRPDTGKLLNVVASNMRNGFPTKGLAQ